MTMRYQSNWKFKRKVKDANWRVWVIRIGNPVGEHAPAWEFVSGWLEKRIEEGDVVDVDSWRDMWMGRGKVSMGDRVRGWVEGLMNRERQGRRFYGKCTNVEVMELKRLGVARPTEVMREIERRTVKMVVEYYEKIKEVIRRPPWQGGEGGTGEASCEGLWGGDEEKKKK